MDYKLPENLEQNNIYTEISTNRQNTPSNNSFDSQRANETTEFGGLIVSRTNTVTSGTSGSLVLYSYLIPTYAPNPEYEISLINISRLLGEAQEVRKK